MKKQIILCLLVLLCAVRGYGQTPAAYITTFLGTGTLNDPRQMAKDASGNIYIADFANNVVRRVTPGGSMSIFAGTGTAGSSGDTGPANSAQLNHPVGLAFDAAGDLYISEGGRIRKVFMSSGTIDIFAGGGTGPTIVDGISALGAYIPDAECLAFSPSSGDLFISEPQYGRLRKINQTTGIISTYAGGSSPFYIFQQFAIDASDNIYYIPGFSHCVAMLNTSGTVTTIAGSSTTSGYSGDGGLPTSALLNRPISVELAPNSDIFIADSGNHVIRKIDHTTGYITTFAGNATRNNSGDGGLATSAGIGTEGYLLCDGNSVLFIEDQLHNVIRRTLVENGPTFVGGISQHIDVCQNAINYPLNYLLRVNDADAGQTLTWSIVNPPSHGSLSISYSASSGGTVIPSGLTYTPTFGYTGVDNFAVQVTDGIAITITAINVNVVGSTPSISGGSSVCVLGTIALTDGALGGIWSSSNPSVAAVNDYTGIVTGVSSGNALITYSIGCATNAIKSVTIKDQPTAIGGAMQTCTGTYSLLNDAMPFGTWSSSNTSIATVTSSGNVGGASSGTVTITYSTGCGTPATTSFIVIAPPASITGTSSVCMGGTVALTETTTGGTWSSSNTAVAVVDASGNVTSVSPGTTTISYNNGCSPAATKPFTVNDVPVVSAISGANRVCIGSDIYLTNSTPGGTWSSSAPTKANINSSGMAHGIANGVTTISYTVTNSCGTTTSVMNLEVGTHLPQITYPDTGRIMCRSMPHTFGNDISGGTWSISSTSWANINSSTGVVTGVTSSNTSAHTAIITYTASTICGTGTTTLSIRVKGVPYTSYLTAEKNVCTGAEETFTITGYPYVAGYTTATWSPATTSNALLNIYDDYYGTIQGLSTGTAVTTFTYHFSKLDDSNTCAGDAPPVRFNIRPKPTYTLNGPSALSTGGGTCAPSSGSLTITIVPSWGHANLPAWSVSSGTFASLGCLSSCGSTNTLNAVSSGGTETITFSATGDYCTVPYTTTLTVPVNSCKPGRDISEEDMTNIKIYPNPNSGKFTMELPTSKSSAAISIADLTGRIIISRISVENKVEFDLSPYPRGTYVISVQTEETKYTGKITLE